MIDVLSLFNPIRNDFVHFPEGLGIERSSFTSFNKSLFVLFLSLLSEVEDLLIATVLSSFRTSITDKGSFLRSGQSVQSDLTDVGCMMRLRLISFEIVDGPFPIFSTMERKVSHLIPP